MARPIDYSKWKDIEVSDDEDDTHPNIDTPSLFKWRHEARVQRMQEFEEKKKQVEEEQKAKQKQLEEAKKKVQGKANDPSMDSLRKSINELEKKAAEASRKMEEVKKEEKLQAWNVDTISKEGFNKTVVNKDSYKDTKKNLTDEEREDFMKTFVKKYKKEIIHFGFLRRFDDSRAYLLEHTYLACEETANFLVIECINHAMDEKFDLMEHIAHQCIAIQYLLELAKQLDIDPRACISSFFSKIQKADPEYKKAFEDELVAFKLRIRRRAKEKVEEAIKQAEEEERQARIGPGGLDPSEVFESLPESMQKCFESQDIGLLQQTIREMPEEDARYHMKRCVDSGLWKPAADDPDTNPEDGFRKKDDGEESKDDGEEDVYEKVD